jgi:hypothetical protein
VHPGDEVIVLEPCYDSYVPNIELAGGIPVRVPLVPGSSGLTSTASPPPSRPDPRDPDQQPAQPERHDLERRGHAHPGGPAGTHRHPADQ